ncbi:PIN domain nuclease [Xylophilus sp. GOD-11R]|uniref:type II toxin-antitoxin system VapC family toxin n=1 Tax=Xylophilus sp. GOD-11R TaxID=3089814 RepID=UPI00298D2FE4|nr:PIN domain nuclease [Xylophilus sp. GOD-11R]WPB57975.1 PIN domain nuclease [Xylophilus sp. GOD-11R]
MLTVDSSVWIAYFNGCDTPQTRLLDEALEDSAQEIVVLDLVLMEVLRGFRVQKDFLAARRAFSALPMAVAGGQAVALRAASIYRDLRALGVTVRSAIDLMVGAWCVENDCPLLHGDRDFAAIERLRGWGS